MKVTTISLPVADTSVEAEMQTAGFAAGAVVDVKAIQDGKPQNERASLQHKLRDFEVQILKPSSYVPIWSTLTGLVQVVYGFAETIGAFSAYFTSKANAWITRNVEDKTKHNRQASHELEFVKHGAANMFRGLIAMIPVVGNIALGINDYAKGFEYRYPAFAEPTSATLEDKSELKKSSSSDSAEVPRVAAASGGGLPPEEQLEVVEQQLTPRNSSNS